MAEKLNEGGNTITQGELLKGMRELQRINRRIDDAAEVLAGQKALKKAEIKRLLDKGANKVSLKMLETLAEMDEDERVDALNTLGIYGGWTNIKLWTAPSDEEPQGTMFDEATAEELQGLKDGRAESDGRNSRRELAPYEANTYPIGSSEHQAWSKGWKAQDKKLGQSDTTTASARRKKDKPAPEPVH
jgi:hypothetical protein